MTVPPPQWWNELPAAVRTAESLTSFRKRLETRLFRVHLVLPSTEKCTYSKSLWTKVSAKCPKYKCNHHKQIIPFFQSCIVAKREFHIDIQKRGQTSKFNNGFSRYSYISYCLITFVLYLLYWFALDSLVLFEDST